MSNSGEHWKWVPTFVAHQCFPNRTLHPVRQGTTFPMIVLLLSWEIKESRHSCPRNFLHRYCLSWWWSYYPKSKCSIHYIGSIIIYTPGVSLLKVDGQVIAVVVPKLQLQQCKWPLLTYTNPGSSLGCHFQTKALPRLMFSIYVNSKGAAPLIDMLTK